MGGAKNTSSVFDEAWLRAYAATHRLAPRETELLTLLMRGYVETAELALLMDIKPGSIKQLFRQIFAKTRTTSRTDLVLSVLRHHFATGTDT